MASELTASRPPAPAGAASVSRLPAIVVTLVLGPGAGHYISGLAARGLAFSATALLAGCGGLALLLIAPIPALVALAMVPLLYVAAIVDLARLRADLFGRAKVLLLCLHLGALVVAPVITAQLLRAFVVESFKTPSSAMSPALLVGDHFFVDKRQAGARAAERGGIIVFPYPAQPQQDFVSRVIGMPNDRIEQRGTALFINGAELRRCSLGTAQLSSASGPAKETVLLVEFLGGSAYLVMYHHGGERDQARSWTVPAGEVFVAGDNRDNAHDSRAWNEGRGGFVPIDTIKGRAGQRFLRAGVFTSGNVDDIVLPRGAEALQPELDKCLAERPAIAEATPPAP